MTFRCKGHQLLGTAHVLIAICARCEIAGGFRDRLAGGGWTDRSDRRGKRLRPRRHSLRPPNRGGAVFHEDVPAGIDETINDAVHGSDYRDRFRGGCSIVSTKRCGDDRSVRPGMLGVPNRTLGRRTVRYTCSVVSPTDAHAAWRDQLRVEEGTVMADRDLVKTGITGLDSILADGIPRGNLILLEGGIGTGKTTLGVEFIYRGAREFDEPGIIVLFEVSPERLVRDAGAARVGSSGARARAQTQNHFHDPPGVRPGTAAGRQPPPRRSADRLAPAASSSTAWPGVTGVSAEAAGRGARRLSPPRRGPSARESHRRPRGRATAFSRTAAGGPAGRIHCRHGHPAPDGRGDASHRAIARDRQVAGTPLSDGAAYLQDPRWSRHGGVSAGAGSSEPGS